MELEAKQAAFARLPSVSDVQSVLSVLPDRQAEKLALLFNPDDLDGIALHPPIQRFLMRWQPGDPVVYLGALWAR